MVLWKNSGEFRKGKCRLGFWRKDGRGLIDGASDGEVEFAVSLSPETEGVGPPLSRWTGYLTCETFFFFSSPLFVIIADHPLMSSRVIYVSFLNVGWGTKLTDPINLLSYFQGPNNGVKNSLKKIFQC